MSFRTSFFLCVLSVLVLGSTVGAAPPRRVTMSVEAFGNSIEGSTGPRCDVSNEVGTGKQTEWWITIGEARPDPQGGWAGVDNAIRCGVGAFEEPPAGSGSSPRTPYLMVTVSTRTVYTATSRIPEEVLQMEIALSLRKLSDFSATGEPRYEQSAEKRNFFLESGTAFLPLVVSNGKEKDAFKLYEALLRIRAQVAGKEGAAAYGAVSVSSDLDGAELLLDGGIVGRVLAGKETVLTNVLLGDREVSVRDSSGRQVQRVVHVEENRTVMVALNLPNPAGNATPYRLVSLGQNTQGYGEYRREMDGAVVVRIPEGEFLMGNKETERQPLEHRVYVSEFLMDKTAVTWGQFKKFAGATGTSLPPHPPYWGIHDNHPAVFVTWEEAKAYCEWVGGRLPTEAEREKAARGTDGRKYPWGNEEPTPERAVYRRSWGLVATDPVGAHPSGASPYGLSDMGGNVWEWCADWYDDKYYEVSPARDPKGPPSGQAHVVRGGSWDSRPDVLSASCRSWGYRGYREGDFGFRCAMDPGTGDLAALSPSDVQVQTGKGKTYYVRQTVGDNANDGLSPATAWRDIRKLSAALEAGDTAYIGPGLYRDEIRVGRVRNEGTAEQRIVFIADTTGQHTGDPPGVVMITGAEPVDEGIFVAQSAPGVYSAPFSACQVRGVVEMDGNQYKYASVRGTKEYAVDKVPGPDVVAKRPSSFFYDESAKMLYIHTSDGKPPSSHEIELICRGNGISIVGRRFVTVAGFTFRHLGLAGVSFFNGASDGIAVNNTSYGSHQGIQVYNTASVVVKNNVLFRNENAGVYFTKESVNGQAVGNVAYENVKGLRWGSKSTNGQALDNLLFDNHERGLAIEYSDNITFRRNRVANNEKSQLLVTQSAYDSDDNCFSNGRAEQFSADFFFTDRYKTLAEYQQGKQQDLHSRDSDCGPLSEKVDVHKLHAEIMGYAERARKTLSEAGESSSKKTKSSE